MTEGAGAFPPIDLSVRPPFAVDGEFSFDALLQRIHPAASRVRTLARETPTTFPVFDLLVDDESSLLDVPLEARRRLECFCAGLPPDVPVRLSPATTERDVAERWMTEMSGLDGAMATSAAAARACTFAQVLPPRGRRNPLAS